MTVKVDGVPKPTVSWYKDGLEIQSCPEFQIEEFEDGTCTLTVPQVFPDDNGEITVQAYNDLGVATTSTALEVIGNFYAVIPIICSAYLLLYNLKCFILSD